MKMKKVAGAILDTRYGTDEGLTYATSPYRVTRYFTDHGEMDTRIFVSYKTQKRWLKNKRQRQKYRDRHKG